jgi:hypothetical protein
VRFDDDTRITIPVLVVAVGPVPGT